MMDVMYEYINAFCLVGVLVLALLTVRKTRRAKIKLENTQELMLKWVEVGDITPDSNGKAYRYFHLITDGEFKGMYRPILTFGHSEYRNNVRDSEMADIMSSGFDIYAVDPKGS